MATRDIWEKPGWGESSRASDRTRNGRPTQIASRGPWPSGSQPVFFPPASSTRPRRLLTQDARDDAANAASWASPRFGWLHDSGRRRCESGASRSNRRFAAHAASLSARRSRGVVEPARKGRFRPKRRGNALLRRTGKKPLIASSARSIPLGERAGSSWYVHVSAREVRRSSQFVLED